MYKRQTIFCGQTVRQRKTKRQRIKVVLLLLKKNGNWTQEKQVKPGKNIPGNKQSIYLYKKHSSDVGAADRAAGGVRRSARALTPNVRNAELSA